VLLVVLAVLGGAILLRSADASQAVLAARRDLPSGVPLQADDLQPVRVRLPAEQLRAYVPPGRAVLGARLTAGLPKGSLLPTGMLAPADQRADLVDYPIPVQAVDVPDVRPGDRVAVAVSYDDGPRRGQGVILLSSVEVVRVLHTTGGLGTPDQVHAVQVRLPKERLAAVAGAVAGGRISVAKLQAGDLSGVHAGRPASPTDGEATGTGQATGTPAPTSPTSPPGGAGDPPPERTP